jgi:hypothetical protein
MSTPVLNMGARCPAIDKHRCCEALVQHASKEKRITLRIIEIPCVKNGSMVLHKHHTHTHTHRMLLFIK